MRFDDELKVNKIIKEERKTEIWKEEEINSANSITLHNCTTTRRRDYNL